MDLRNGVHTESVVLSTRSVVMVMATVGFGLSVTKFGVASELQSN
jgi:hypothetical protein